MALDFLKKLFSSAEPEPQQSAATAKSAPRPTAASTQEPDVKAFIDYVARALVDVPEKVAVTADDSGDDMIIRIACEKGDVGKLIGKKGKTVAAIRALANGTVRRGGKRINVEILD